MSSVPSPLAQPWRSANPGDHQVSLVKEGGLNMSDGMVVGYSVLNTFERIEQGI